MSITATCKQIWYWAFSLAWLYVDRLCIRVRHHARLYTLASCLSWWLDERRFDYE